MKRVSLLFSIAIPVFALIALFNVFTPPVHAVEVGGLIYNDTTWTLANSPYIVTSDLYIDNGTTLTIEAGVEVYAEDNEAIEVLGHLNAGSDMGPTTIISGFSTIRFGFYDAFPEGSGDITNTVIHGDGITSYGIEIIGVSDDVVSIKNSVIQNQAIPIQAYVENLHRLQMENVSFVDNNSNQVFISYDRDTPILNGNVILRGHPGLESYEFTSDGTDMYVPSGITLTLEAGAIITGEYGIAVGGYFAANGTAASPITIRGRYYLKFYNSANIHHTIMNGNEIKNYDFVIQIRGNSTSLVSIKDSIIKNYRKYPISTYPSSIHRLHMENVSFVSDTENWVHIKSGESFTKNVTLVPYPGLAGYEISDLSAGGLFWTYIPSGITFTLESGVTLLADTILEFKGHFIANGSVAAPTIITGTSAIDFAESGSADITHTTISSDEVDNGSIKIKGNSNNLISIKDSIMQGLYHPIVTYDNSLHRLQMDNVSFVNNVHNRVFITFSDVSQDVVLTPQPGLEGYEIRDNLWFDGSPAPSTFVVPDGNSLTLEDGVSLFSVGNKTIEVNGRFIANGTQLNPVNITSSNDAAPGEWGGISVNGGEVILNHTNLRNGEVNLALTSPTSTVTISNSTVISASQSGISVTEGLLNIECSVLSENGLAGLWVDSSGTPDVTINHTDIWGNGAGITNTNSTFIDARYNWWGASDGPNGDFSGSGDTAFGNILHSPWLNTPNDCAQPPFRVFLPMILGLDN